MFRAVVQPGRRNREGKKNPNCPTVPVRASWPHHHLGGKEVLLRGGGGPDNGWHLGGGKESENTSSYLTRSDIFFTLGESSGVEQQKDKGVLPRKGKISVETEQR